MPQIDYLLTAYKTSNYIIQIWRRHFSDRFYMGKPSIYRHKQVPEQHGYRESMESVLGAKWHLLEYLATEAHGNNSINAF